ncbi:hypothetical protein Godav_005305 [Gossypium davidsonii]|uniref:Reverse transcriptase zinc-binding domain-containing protein n=2 Tax=Gossypium TaxID=3633 RepID=A0A7J8TJM3_GOSDV|nr:hypothetical protein [Gossypium davidsonii]MBA0653576.1 hypothetical protein [Gossypium klotzschianum]
MNSTVVKDATYCRSRTPNKPTSSSLSIRTQAFTYIKVYELRINSLSSNQDLDLVKRILAIMLSSSAHDDEMTRRIAADNSCPVCRSAAKSVDHLIRECPFTRQAKCKLIAISFWALWFNRNIFIMREQVKMPLGS